jgi:hypothetical protein
MTGYVTTAANANAALEAIASAFDVRSLPRFWSPGKYLVHSGDHAGLYFLPAGDGILGAPLMGSPVQTPQDFPEFAEIIAALGGLDARVQIDPAELIDPDVDELGDGTGSPL